MALRRILAVAVAVAVVGSALAVPAAAAQTDQPDWADDLYEDAATMVDEYNEHVEDEHLGAVAGQLKGENVDLVVRDEASDETAVYSFETNDDLEIESLSPGPHDDPTLEMTTDRETVEEIEASDRPDRAFRDAVSSGDIEVSGITTVNKIKWTVINGVGEALGLLG